MRHRFIFGLLVLLALTACGQEDVDNPNQSRESGLLLQQPQASESLRTRYPVILAHGLGASGALFSFHPVAQHLAARGVVSYVTEVSAFASVAHRSFQLRDQVRAIMRQTGAAKVSIVAHSMGGLDSRYLICTLGMAPQIASLVTVSTPHRGTPFADEVIDDLNSRIFGGVLLRRFIGRMASLYNHSMTPRDADVAGALRNLSTSYVRHVFNPNCQDDSRVRYLSLGGVANTPGGDPLNSVLEGSYETIHRWEGANDGLVSPSSARWGEYLGTLPSDHFDEVGVGAARQRNFDFLAFYVRVAAWLKSSNL